MGTMLMEIAIPCIDDPGDGFPGLLALAAPESGGGYKREQRRKKKSQEIQLCGQLSLTGHSPRNCCIPTTASRTVRLAICSEHEVGVLCIHLLRAADI